MKGEMQDALKALRRARQRIIDMNEGRAQPLSNRAQQDAADLVMEAKTLVEMFMPQIVLKHQLNLRRSTVLEEIQIASVEGRAIFATGT